VKAAATFAAGQEVANVLSAKVVALTERVVKAMLIAKLKTLATVLLGMAVLGGGGVLSLYPTLKAEHEPARAAAPAVGASTDDKPNSDKELLHADPRFTRASAASTDDKPKSDKDLIQGVWIPVSVEQNGEKLAKEKFEGGKMVLTEDKITLHVLVQDKVPEGTYTIDPDKKPKEIDMKFGDATMMGLYELKGTTLKVVMTERGRPSDFDSAGATLVIFERKK
jgi:uncharacterized protein (TIGR03067 family)